MHRLRERDPRYSEIQLKAAKVFQKGVTKVEIKVDDTRMQ